MDLLGLNTNPETAAEWEARLAKIAPNEKYVAASGKLKKVAEKNGWEKDNKLTKKNNRTVYRDPATGKIYAFDTQHGRFEVLDKNGNHIDEVYIDGKAMGKKTKVEDIIFTLNNKSNKIQDKMVKLIDFKENNICRGMVLRCKGKYPYEAIVDFLVCETPDSGAKTFQLIVISGFKAGAKYYQFPEESLPKDRSRYGLSTHWLRDNWYKYGYIDCPLEDVYIYESQVPTKFERFFGDEEWHKNGAKSDYLGKFEKKMKGDTNADLYINKDTNDIYLKTNRKEIWIDTGDKLE